MITVKKNQGCELPAFHKLFNENAIGLTFLLDSGDDSSEFGRIRSNRGELEFEVPVTFVKLDY